METKRILDTDTLLFFDRHPEALPLYEAFGAMIRAEFPEADRRVRKTQISFFHRHVFACVSLLRVKRKAEMPDPYLVVTLGLPGPLASGRVAVQSEPYPGRWTVHILIGSTEEIDEELIVWIRQAYTFSERKQRPESRMK